MKDSLGYNASILENRLGLVWYHMPINPVTQVIEVGL